jgi:hypothetical protein
VCRYTAGRHSEWSGILTEPYAAASMNQVKADLKDTDFAWSGATTAEAGTNITAYYRIQGPHLVVEYAPQSDEPGNHGFLTSFWLLGVVLGVVQPIVLVSCLF